MEPVRKKAKSTKKSPGLLGFFARTDPSMALKPRRRYRFQGGSIELPEFWYAREDSLLVRRMSGAHFSCKRVAAFDFDGCLTTDSGPVNGGDRVPIRDGVIEKLRALYDGTSLSDDTSSFLHR